MVGLLGYVFVYTLWLKPLTPQNIVIGGSRRCGSAAGRLGRGRRQPQPGKRCWPFLIVFFWTPPHFWALSLMIKDDYERTGVPMLPVVKGEADTRRQILIYTRLHDRLHRRARTAPACSVPFYLASAIVLGTVFFVFSFALWRNPSAALTLRTYLYSLAYLALLFVAMAVDAVVLIKLRSWIARHRNPTSRPACCSVAVPQRSSPSASSSRCSTSRPDGTRTMSDSNQIIEPTETIQMPGPVLGARRSSPSA